LTPHTRKVTRAHNTSAQKESTTKETKVAGGIHVCQRGRDISFLENQGRPITKNMHSHNIGMPKTHTPVQEEHNTSMLTNHCLKKYTTPIMSLTHWISINTKRERTILNHPITHCA
jgi:hypothetical protein